MTGVFHLHGPAPVFDQHLYSSIFPLAETIKHLMAPFLKTALPSTPKTA